MGVRLLALLLWPCFMEVFRKGTCEKGQANSDTEQHSLRWLDQIQPCHQVVPVLLKTKAHVSALFYVSQDRPETDMSWYFVNEDCLVFKPLICLDIWYHQIIEKKHGKADRRVGCFSGTLNYSSVCSIVTSFLPRLSRSFQANSLGWVVLHIGCNALLPVPHTPSSRNTSGANFFPLWVTAYALFLQLFFLSYFHG